MGGLVKEAGRFFDSDIGRVLAGVTTGGLSEAGRVAAKHAVKLGVDPDLAAVGGAAVGARLGGPSTPGSLAVAKPQVPGAGVTHAPEGVTLASAAGTVTGNATDAEARVEAERLRALEASDAARTRAEADLAARTETPQEAFAARRRAGEIARRVGSGARRASQYLAGV